MLKSPSINLNRVTQRLNRLKQINNSRVMVLTKEVNRIAKVDLQPLILVLVLAEDVEE